MLTRSILTTILIAFICISLTLSSPLHSIGSPLSAEATNKNQQEYRSSTDVLAINEDDTPSYLEVVQAQSHFAAALPDISPIVVNGADYESASEDASFTINGEVLQWKLDDQNWVQWKIEIPADGLYNLGLVYDTFNNQSEDIVRGLQVDGAYPFAEAKRLRIKRQFEQDYPPARDDFNNDRRPPALQLSGWKDERFADYDVATQPLLWSLSKGTHIIRLVGVNQPMQIRQLYAAPPVSKAFLPTEETNRMAEANKNGKWILTIEAENFSRKSNPSIQLVSTDDALISPASNGMIRYNSIGGEQFRQSGQWLEWDFEVPHDGAYKIGFKYYQAFISNLSSFRTITIDGKPLNEESEVVTFPYSTKWRGMELSDEAGDELLIPLKGGKHTLRMTVTAKPAKMVYEEILKIMEQLSELNDSIRKITGNFEKAYTTGGNVDLNRDWELEKYIPDLREQLQEIIDAMIAEADKLKEISTGTSEAENALRISAADLEKMRDKTRDIPNRLNKLEQMRSNLGTWLFRMLDQPVMFDYLWVAEPKAKKPRATPNLFGTVSHSVGSFFRTFTIDYDTRRKADNAIDVWVKLSRDYVNLIQQLADDDFTTKTGITVNVNIVPDPQMFILGNAAGIQPDVALGVDMAMPVDFAQRGALLDLSQFPDYKEATRSFLPGSLRPFHYNGGDYAIPEVIGFNTLVYRSDILERLGVKPPNTWEDLYKVIRTLQQNGLDFYINPKSYMPFLYQNGGDLYTFDGMSSGLDTDSAFEGFKQLTDLFVLYQFPKEVPSFFNHFRLGDIPIGIADYNTYLQIQFAAPELAGKWGMLPIPGTVQKDGTVARWDGGNVMGGMIYKKTEKKEQAWEFLKWWTSAQTQTTFGNEIESIFGPEYRWNTANMDAIANLPWPTEQLKVIQEQLSWFKEVPQVPGGYFSARQIDFAWNNIIVANKNVRESLDKAVIEINREMKRKQIEFKLRDELGNILDPLDIQNITQQQKLGEEQ